MEEYEKLNLLQEAFYQAKEFAKDTGLYNNPNKTKVLNQILYNTQKIYLSFLSNLSSDKDKLYHKEIKDFLNDLEIKNYTIYKDGTVDVNGDVYLASLGLTKIPVKFGKVTGNFNCSNNQLTSLEYAPKEVNGYFNCSNNQLTSLEYAPKEVTGSFYCSNNNLTSLEYAPKTTGSFNCSNNKLTSLEYAPKEVNGYFNCSNNQLTSLEYTSKIKFLY